MEELVNQAKVEGFYQNQKIQITSNLLKTKMEKPLSIILNVDKKTWKNGFLTYTIQIQNLMEKPLINANVTVPLNPTFVSLLKESVKQDEKECSYTYDSHHLCIFLKENKKQKTIITFKVQPKELDFFLLETTCFLTFQEEVISSNPVTVLHPIKRKLPYSGCELPYWRI